MLWDLADRSLRRGGFLCRLDRRASQVLECLVRRPGEIVSKEELIARVWDGRHVTDDVVTKAIGAIRRGLARTSGDRRWVETVRGEGYRLLAPVRRARAPLTGLRLAVGIAAVVFSAVGVLLIWRAPEVSPVRLAGSECARSADCRAGASTTDTFAPPRGDRRPDPGPTGRRSTSTEGRPAGAPAAGPLDVSNAQPSWSPDGRSIAFISDRDGLDRLYVARTDGSQVIPVTVGDAPVAEPAWSPDGGAIAYSSRVDGNWDVYVLDLRTGGTSRVTEHPAADFQPVWAPDGEGLLLASARSGNLELFLTRLDGTAPRNLTNHSARDVGGSFSPKGDEIAFSSNRAVDGTWAVYVMAATGGDVRRVTFGTDHCSSPRWSPDGGILAFKRERAGSADLLALSLRDGSIRPLVQDARNVHEPAWSPDGGSLAFHVRGLLGRDIFIRDLARRLETPLTSGAA